MTGFLNPQLIPYVNADWKSKLQSTD